LSIAESGDFRVRPRARNKQITNDTRFSARTRPRPFFFTITITMSASSTSSKRTLVDFHGDDDASNYSPCPKDVKKAKTLPKPDGTGKKDSTILTPEQLAVADRDQLVKHVLKLQNLLAKGPQNAPLAQDTEEVLKAKTATAREKMVKGIQRQLTWKV
jgi:hypothetical protein